MKESKKIDNLNEELDKETEKRFNEELNEIKEKLNAEKLSDEFKANLNAKLQEELNKNEEVSKGKILKFPTISRKLAGICACFVFLFSSCLVFADDIENVILELFGNTDKIIAKAIEEGNYKEIEMDYLEYQGVSIKVDYVAVDEEDLYIAFNVLSEEKFDEVYFYDIIISSQGDTVIYDKNSIKENVEISFEERSIDNKNSILIYKLINFKNNLNDLNELNFNIRQIHLLQKSVIDAKVGKWDFKINV